MSKADNIFINMCNDIIENGYSSEGQNIRPKWDDGKPAHTIKKFGAVNRYDLQEEFPILTLRPINFKAAVDEILWIWQKKSNKIVDLKSRIWDSWANEDGNIGKAYGYQLGRKIDFPEGNMDQVDWILKSLKENPYNRRMVTSIFNHDDLKDMELQPCAWSLTFNVTGDRLNAVLNQRSQDVLVANSWNVCQYAVLVHMFANVSGLKAGDLLHVIADAHIYDRHIPIVKDLIKREVYDAPKLVVNTDIKNFYDYKVEDFKLEGYKSGEPVKNIPVAV